MLKEDGKIISKRYLFIAIVVILVAISYFIIKPYFVAIISAFILAYLVKPFYDKIKGTLGKNTAALLSLILIIAAIIIPIALVMGTLLQQIAQSLNSSAITGISDAITKIPIFDNLNFSLASILSKLSGFIIEKTASILIYIPSFLITALITIIGIFYILTNWDYLSDRLKDYIPVKNKKKVSEDLGSTTYNIVFGYTFIAIIEFFIAGIGFYLSGVKFFIALPALIALFAFIPGLGPLAVWIPTALVYLFEGNYGTMVGVIITGLILTIIMDYIVAPKFIGKRTKIHPMVMLIGIFGGVSLFGVFGFIVGPLILVYTIKLVEEIINQEKGE